MAPAAIIRIPPIMVVIESSRTGGWWPNRVETMKISSVMVRNMLVPKPKPPFAKPRLTMTRMISMILRTPCREKKYFWRSLTLQSRRFSMVTDTLKVSKYQGIYTSIGNFLKWLKSTS